MIPKNLDLNKIEEEDEMQTSLHNLLGFEDTKKQCLSQGIYKDHWYFGKCIELNDRPVDSIIFDDGRVYLNMKQSFTLKDKEFITARNQIKELGIEYSDSLMPVKNTWSQVGLKNFVEKLKTSSVDSVDSVGENELGLNSLLSSEKRAQIRYLLIHNIENNGTTLTYTTTSQTTLTTLLTTLKNIQEFFMDVSDKRVFTITSLYIICTYCFELFNAIGYLFFCSDSGSGKTKYADIIRFLSFSSINATNPSEAVLFRILQQTRGTLLIDDYENIDDKRKGAIDQILKVGYKRGGQTIRAEKIGDSYVPKFFDVYSPKIITNTIGLDSITYSRCIPIHLLKTTTNKGMLDPSEFDDIWGKVRDQCYEFVMFNWKEIRDAYFSLRVEELNNRDLELVKPLLALAKFFGDDIFEETKSYLLKIFRERDMYDFGDDWDFVLFDSIRDYFGDSGSIKSEWLTSNEILDLMMQRLTIDEGNAKPSVRWIGRTLGRIDLIEKRRLAKGMQYRFDTNSLHKYMKARGWYKEGDDLI